MTLAVTAHGWMCAGTFLASVAAPMAFLEWDHRRRHRSEFSTRFDLPLEDS